ncbi:MAG: OsmC family protein [Flavipsychrobacter sp.]
MSITHNYEVSVKWLNDRKGVLASKELNDEIGVATPPQFPNGMEGIWSPEHLFTAAVNSCLMTTFLAIAENSRLNYQQFESNASGKLEMVDGKYIMSEVILRPVVTIENEEERARAERVLQKSEQNCLISNSITSKIIFEPTVNVLAKSEVI